MTRARTLLVTLVAAIACAVPASAQAIGTPLVRETFANSTLSNPNFLVGGEIDTTPTSPCLTAGTDTAQAPIPGCHANQPSIPVGGDPEGQGTLRLTSNGNDTTGFVLYQAALPFTAGLDVTFSYYAYHAVETDTGFGADGVSFFLADGSQPLHIPGAFGGSLGYAQRNTPFLQDGLLGGYLGLGLDEWGNFGNNEEGRGQGCNQPDNGFYPDHVTLRGPGNGQTGYCILDRVDVSSRGALDAPSAQSRTDADVRRTVHITVDPPSEAGARISVELAYGNGPLEPVLDEPEPANPPPTFKFGFAASTGGANNIHEIQGVSIDSILPLPRLVITKTDTGPFTVGGPGHFVLTPATEADPALGPVQAPVTVTDDLPAGTLSGTPAGAGWDCSASSGIHVSCTRPASPEAPIEPDTTLPPITVDVAFGPDESGIFDNVAQVNSQDNANTPQQSSATDRFNVLPTGADDAATTTVGVPVGVPILANDHGSLQPSTVTITRQPANGTAAWDVNTGEALYTPNPGFSGIDTFTYRVLDQSGQEVNQTVTITVTPRAQDDAGRTPVNTPITLDVLANDLGNLNPATVAVVTPPGHGTVTVNASTGQVTYTPAPGFTGQDTFVYSVRDHAGQLTSATVTILVYAPPAPPPPLPPTPPPVQQADLAITKTVSPRIAAVGDVLTYTVTVTNRGPDTARQIVGVDVSQDKIRLLSLRPSRGSCQSRPRLECSLDALGPGQTVTVVARVQALAPGALSDVAAVTAVTPDPDSSNNHAHASARVVAAPLTITKHASARYVRTGATVSFTIRVSNPSRYNARTVTVCDRLPAGLAYVSGGTRRGTQVCWTVGSLPSRHSRTFVVQTRAVASHSRGVTNIATVRAPGLPTRSARARVVIISPSFTG